MIHCRKASTFCLGLGAYRLYGSLRDASAGESRIIALEEFVDPIEFSGPGPHGHRGDGHGEMVIDDGQGEPTVMGGLLMGDGEKGRVALTDLETGEMDQGRFDSVGGGFCGWMPATWREPGTGTSSQRPVPRVAPFVANLGNLSNAPCRLRISIKPKEDST